MRGNAGKETLAAPFTGGYNRNDMSKRRHNYSGHAFIVRLHADERVWLGV